jgi:hypothetical protein
VGHSYLGERYILMRLFRREDLPRLFGTADFTKRTLRFAWHLTSVAWLGFAGLLLRLRSAQPLDARDTAHLIAGVSALSGLIALVGSRGRHLSWVVFFAIAALVWYGAR